MEEFSSLLDSILTPGALTHLLQHNRNITPNDFELRFHEYSSDKNEDCSICQEIMKSYVKTECKHKFHKKCLSKWLFETQHCKTTCPMCRTEIKTSNHRDEDEQVIHEKFETIVQSIDTARQAMEDISSLLGWSGHDVHLEES